MGGCDFIGIEQLQQLGETPLKGDGELVDGKEESPMVTPRASCCNKTHIYNWCEQSY
jgi:hypothetical protein